MQMKNNKIQKVSDEFISQTGMTPEFFFIN